MTPETNVFHFIEPRPIPARKVENWVKSFAEYASNSEAPSEMIFWTGISTVAGALGRKVWIDMKYFQWVPNFYIVLVAKPGVVAKSTTMSIGMNILREVPGSKFGPDVVSWQALVQAMAESRQQFLNPDTGEYTDMCALSIASSEFGNLFNPQDREMVDIFVSLWDGQQGIFQKMTKTQGLDMVINPWMNVIAATTPAWIAQNVPEYMIGGGFTSRTIFVYADQKRQLVPYPDAAMGPASDKLRDDLLSDLEAISLIAGPMRLSTEAREWGTQWYIDHWTRPEQYAHLDQNKFGGYLARKQTHIHKLAMVLSAAESHSRIISAENLRAAEQIITSTEAHATRVFSQIGLSATAKFQHALVEEVRATGKIERDELLRRLFSNGTKKEFNDALDGSIAAGFVRLIQTQGKFFVIPHRLL